MSLLNLRKLHLVPHPAGHASGPHIPIKVNCTNEEASLMLFYKLVGWRLNLLNCQYLWTEASIHLVLASQYPTHQVSLLNSCWYFMDRGINPFGVSQYPTISQSIARTTHTLVNELTVKYLYFFENAQVRNTTICEYPSQRHPKTLQCWSYL